MRKKGRKICGTELMINTVTFKLLLL